MEFNKGKDFEQPNAGMYLGTIIDVVDMPNCQTAYGLKNKVRILWTLTNVDNSPALDKEGVPLTVAFIKPASQHEKSDVYKMLSQILNGPPPLMNNTEDLANLLLNRSNVLFITKTPHETIPGKFWANVTGVAPLQPGQIAPVAPKGFVRDSLKPKTAGGGTQFNNQRPATAAPQSAPAQAPPAAFAAPAAPAVNANVAF
jgi:hypothetical protein